MESGALHENLVRNEAAEGSSDRGFGIVFSVFFLIIAGLQWWHARPHWYFGLAASAALLLFALLWPRILSYPNRVWTRLGLALFRFISPIMMAVIFYGTIWPIASVLRLSGKVIIPTKLDPTVSTYWIRRSPGEPTSASMMRQF